MANRQTKKSKSFSPLPASVVSCTLLYRRGMAILIYLLVGVVAASKDGLNNGVEDEVFREPISSTSATTFRRLSRSFSLEVSDAA
jgi:hypothetical protein